MVLSFNGAPALALALGLFMSGALSVKIEQNYQTVTSAVGDEVDLVCTADIPKKSCLITPPYSSAINVFEGVIYEEGRILPKINSERECGIKITKLEEKDNGEWKCQVDAVAEGGRYSKGEGQMTVIVAVAPQSLQLRINGEEQRSEKLVIRLSESERVETAVECVARQARPKPEFKWFIGETQIQGNIVDTEENPAANGKADYVQTLRYFADSKHNGQALKCVAENQGYNKQQREAGENSIQKELELLFKPKPKAKEQAFYGLKEGHSENVKIKFEANPLPTTGHWTIAGVEKPIQLGAGSVDGQFISGFPAEEELPGEYSVTLTIKEVKSDMAGKKNKLMLSNEYGETEYPFVLELGDKPPADGDSSEAASMNGVNVAGEPLGSGPIIGVIVVIVIILILVGIAVIARSKGILCFAAKNGEPLQEEKDALDKAEKGEPLNPKDTDNAKTSPEKRLVDTKTEGAAGAEQEEKKSNGAHTPV